MSNFLPESKFFDKLLTQLLGESVLVLGHRRPDGDCVGSQVAFTRALLGLGIDARAVNQDSAPRILKKFIGNTPFLQPNEIEDSEALIITVDCADHARVGEELMNRFPSVLLNIDHHVSNTHYAKNNFVFADASATAEILAKFFLDLEYKLDRTTAEALYLGICTDTGQFCYSGTNASVFEVCRNLCQAGANPSKIAHELYEREKPGRIQLLQKFLASFRMEFEDRVCIGSLQEKFYLETATSPEDAEDFVDYARSLEGVEIGGLIEERNGKLKGSFRAKDKRYRVDLLAKEFSGGGHACAAGYNLDTTIENFYPCLVETIGRHLKTVDGKGF
ncbi:MAG: DHH family phosphoesterase [Opitutae bacterium]|nr:DHH family phosphoesterase [Opitutae bacterium]